MGDLLLTTTKNKFTESDDSELRNLVQEYGKDWKLIADKIKTKNARQCRDRYEKYLAPNLKSEPFTIDEDIQLLTLFKKLGCRWIKISQMMEGRSDVAIKARFRLLKRHGKTIQNLKSDKLKLNKDTTPPNNTKDIITLDFESEARTFDEDLLTLFI
ncbi:RNA polymerase II transcription regulator recruiting protein [Trichomonas vaginalis G3]|uniref:RNA polymerase II transcription regulator recruiting protein n=1 Tax=Trichomonas vaginalis (strain ATCC PRA-98 / G3) TaxID=412133 RepID=UPI0021E5DB06|nr:RNA polymerase II transcription regulator recruiting protein [Trichomonas vaginalis G3]KAI5508040.1 RNA polymerase II transcription regulator recruiting protein [Trichomonas vaginalis G3]